jgi:hypothetical protein
VPDTDRVKFYSCNNTEPKFGFCFKHGDGVEALLFQEVSAWNAAAAGVRDRECENVATCNLKQVATGCDLCRKGRELGCRRALSPRRGMTRCPSA